jgi:hypothetical protein
MNEPISQSGRSSIIPALEKLLEKLPHAEQQRLFDELKDRVLISKRKHNRDTVGSEVEFLTTDGLNKGVISNISAGGVFIETRMPFRCGEDIRLKFTFPQAHGTHLRLYGQIVRITSDGIGVQYKRLSREQEISITSHFSNT